MTEIRVPAKVVRSWTERVGWTATDTSGNITETFEPPMLFCILDDGRVYQSVKVPCSKGPQDSLANYTREWHLHTPAIPDR